MTDNISKIDSLILNGAVEVAAVDENGELLYAFTSKLKEVDPEMYSEVVAGYNAIVLSLWEKGFLSIDVTDPDPTVFLTDLIDDKNEYEKLDDIERRVLTAIVSEITGS